MAVKIGLTGGIGSGKSTVAECFTALDIQVINADQIALHLSQPGTAEFEQIIAQFGTDILDEHGHIHRKRLATVVFASAQKRKRLEAILHPPIRREMSARAMRDKRCYCILEIPLLVESAQYRDMQRVLAVSCQAKLRRVRLQQQRRLAPDEIKRIMRTQASEAQRLAVADDVLDNNHNIADIKPQVLTLHTTYLQLFT